MKRMAAMGLALGVALVWSCAARASQQTSINRTVDNLTDVLCVYSDWDNTDQIYVPGSPGPGMINWGSGNMGGRYQFRDHLGNPQLLSTFDPYLYNHVLGEAALADIDGDGNLDLAYAVADAPVGSGAGCGWRYGNGTTIDGAVPVIASNPKMGIDLVDMDGDGQMDVVYNGYGWSGPPTDPHLTWRKGSGTPGNYGLDGATADIFAGYYPGSPCLVPESVYARYLWGDPNSSSNPYEVLVVLSSALANPDSGQMGGSVVFAVMRTAPGLGTDRQRWNVVVRNSDANDVIYQVTAGDIDHSGQITVIWAQGNYVLGRKLDAGVTSAPGGLILIASNLLRCKSVALGDINDDGNLDIVYGGYKGKTGLVSVYRLGDGAGNFGPPVPFIGNTRSLAFAKPANLTIPFRVAMGANQYETRYARSGMPTSNYSWLVSLAMIFCITGLGLLMRFNRLAVVLACLLLLGLGTVQAARTIDAGAGYYFSRNLMGQNPYTLGPGRADNMFEGKTLEICDNTSMRGPAGGLEADTYNWEDRTGRNVGAHLVGGRPTLEFLRDARDRNTEFIINVNMRGTGSPWGFMTFNYVDQTLSPLATLAANWVRYCNSTVQTYKQGDTIPAGQDATIMATLQWDYWDTLTAPAEAATNPVTYWEIGCEPDSDSLSMYGAWQGWTNMADYVNRYKTITAAMVAQDSAIKVGPDTGTVASGYFAALFADPAARIDFITYHPYYHIADNSTTGTTYRNALDGIAANLTGGYNSTKSLLASNGRSTATPMAATEWAPYDDSGTYITTMWHALGCAETVFTLASLNTFFAANYWSNPADAQDGTEYPVFKLFKEMQTNMAGKTIKMVDNYTDGSHFRMYTTYDNVSNKVVIWGLNFSYNADKTMSGLSVTNLPGTVVGKKVRKLGLLSGGTTSLFSVNTPKDNITIDWTETDNSSLNLASFNMTFPQATVTALVIQLAPSVTVQGTVTLQDYTGVVTGTSATVDIIRTDNGTTVESHSVTLDSSGHYSFTTGLTGTYNVAAKASNWLRRKVTGVNILVGTGATVNFSLINGDCNNDNQINGADLSIILAAMDGTFNPQADLDGDGEITSTDLSIDLTNMDLSGD